MKMKFHYFANNKFLSISESLFNFVPDAPPVMSLLRIIAICTFDNVLCTSVKLFLKTTFALTKIYTSVRFMNETFYKPS